MNIVSAEITGFKLHRSKKTFEFGKVNLISGGNGKGKTTIAEAITWCFYGCDLSGKTRDIFDRLRNKSTKETKVVIRVELPTKFGGGTTCYDFCRIRKGDATSLFLNGETAKQVKFDALLGPMELFLCIFVPGYFGTIAISEPTKARNMLLSMMPKLDFAEVTAELNEDDQVRIQKLDMINPEHSLKESRKEIDELDKSLDSISGKIDYLRINSMLNVPKTVMEKDEQTLISLKEEFASLVAGGAQPFQHDLQPLFQQKTELRIRYDALMQEADQLRAKPLPKAGDKCSACKRDHTPAEAAAELESRQNRLSEVKQECERLIATGNLLKLEIEKLQNENAVALAKFQEERGQKIADKQAEIDRLSDLVRERGHKLKLANDLELQHEIYGETVTEREEKKADMQAVKNFMLQYAEMQVKYVNSFLKLAKVQLFKYSRSTGEIELDFTIVYGEDETEYKSLSTSEKIRCSIELAVLLNRAQDISYPVYIDNAESVEEFDEPVTQYFVAEVVKKAPLQTKIVA